MKKIYVSVLFLLALSGLTFAQSGKPLLMRKPTVNKTHIVFSFAGDLWIVGREGGEAARLTTGTGTETDPFFSPDGTMIAFTGEYDGNIDVYVVPAEGGVPKRLTYHSGGDIALGWTRDGKQVLFRSGRTSNLPTAKFFTIPVDGVFPTEIPLPMGQEASFSPDGARLAYQPFAPAFAQWKKYRGGRTTKIWIANLADSSVEEIPRQNTNDYNPMWVDNKIYFLSDRTYPVTLYSYDPATRRVTQAVANNGIGGLDIKSATAGPDAIVYEQFGSINLFDLKSGKTSNVNITISGDLPGVRPRYERVAGRIVNFALSPTGARAVFEARGDIITVPAEKGNPRNLTNSPGVADRDPAWSPDGKWIAYFSDESGEYALHLREQTGMGEVKKISLGNPSSFFYSPVWSPDSKKVAFTDKRLNLWYLDIDKGTPVKVDTNTYENPFRVMDPSWSPDSKWIAYTKQLKNRLCAVHVYALDQNKATRLTDGLSDARFAVFDKNGKHLYFAASTDAGPTSGWLDMSSTPHQATLTRNVYVIVLKKGEASPLAPESDEEKPQPEGGQPPRPPARPAPVTVTIDFDGIGQRILALPVPARNYTGIGGGRAGVIFIAENPAGATAPGVTMHRFEMDKRKFDKVLDGVTAFELSANGEKMLFGQGFGPGLRLTIASTVAPIRPGEGVLNLADMEVYADPKQEWRQIYREAWRVQRDFFYDPNFHGLDIKATEKKYEPYLEGIAHRADLNYLFQESLGNMVVGHHNSGGGDMPQANFVPGGLLGADYKIENGRYRFAHVYNGENWNPGLRAPLTQPGVDVKAGEYLLAVGGREVRATDNLYSFFEAKANRQVLIKVGPNPDGTGSREVTVVPVGNEGGLRNLAWIEGNRRKVDELSGGKLAYVYLPNTSGAGYTNFNRYYFAQIDKQGAVIDERFNGGGQAADYIIDYMRKPLMNYWATREGDDFTTPIGSIYGPKVMVINEYSSSGGDMMPWLFRKAGVGKLVGKRTWGGLVGVYDYPVFVDGGQVSAPRVAFYNLEGDWEVENYGTAPDIEVDLDPKLWRQGKDAQLERAVEVAMDALKRNPLPKHKKPVYPNYYKTGTRPAPPTPAGNGNGATAPVGKRNR